MASTTTEELVITIKVDDKDASSKLDTLKEKIQQIESISRGKGFQQLSEVASTLTKLAHATDNMGASAKNLRDLGEAANVFSQRVKNIKTGELRDAASAIDSFKGAIGRLNDAGANGGAINIKTANTSAIAKTSDAAKMLADDFKTAVKWGSKIAQIPFRMLFEPIKGVAARVQSLAGAFTGLFAKIGRVAFMRAIRGAIKIVVQAIKEGVGAVYEWASAVGNSFTGTMDTISTSLTYFRNSIGAAISPILDAVAPILDAVIDKCVAVVNVFNQLIATLTGASTWRRAEKVATSYGGAVDDATKGTKAANSAAKELKRTLLGFDEINRLEAPDKDSGTSSPAGGSGSGDVTSGALAFTEQPISTAVADFAQKLKDAWAKADFTEIGTMIGTRVGNALMSIPWTEKIQPVVVNLAKSFGTLLNGMFDYTGSGGKAMWDGIAYTIYNALNTAVLGYVTFFSTVNWNGIGQGIGAALARVVYGINWGNVRQALSAFPNAVIDAVTGFCMRMSPADFHQLGIKIGNTVAGAIIDIKWADFFQNGFKMADRLLQAINGVLEAFGNNWAQIKEGIINGIKSVPEEQWAKIGTDIGNLIFNAATFVANIVDLLVSSLKTGKWASLLNGIWIGIDNSVKEAYGGWGGAAQALGRWIVSNLDIISIALAFSIGAFTIKETAAYLSKELLKKIKLLPTAEQGLTFGDWVKNISFVAGIVLAISTVSSVLSTDFSNQDTLTSIRTAAGLGLKGALSGALIGLKLGGIQGALIGAVVGFGLTMSIAELKSAFDKIKTDPKVFMTALAGGLVGAGIGFIAGGPLGAAFGFTIGVTLTMLVTEIIPEFAHGVEDDAQAVRNGTPNDPSHLELFGDLYSGMTTGNSKKNSSTASSKSEIEVPVKPVINDTQPNLAEQLKTAWDNTINGNPQSPFSTQGLKDDHYNWGIQLDTNWNKVTNTKQTSQFRTSGVKNESTAWWVQLASFWVAVTALHTAGKFTVGGVKNDSGTWWSQVSSAWSNYIIRNDSKLSASVSVDNGGGYGLWNTFVAAFNTLQKYFNNNPLTAKVKTSVGGGLAGNGGHADMATGGVFQNGRWHDITNYAAGGTPGSGQMFIAREAGPELVGTIGGSTAVMNNDQIVQSVANGVASAVAAVMGGQGNSPIEVTVKVDSETLYRTVKKGERKASGRYGTAVAIG